MEDCILKIRGLLRLKDVEPILVVIRENEIIKPKSYKLTFEEQGITEADILAICQKD